MNMRQTAGARTRRAEEARSIAWPDCDANLILAQKTRRAVRDEVISIQERRTRQRHNLGLALMGLGALLLLLAPEPRPDRLVVHVGALPQPEPRGPTCGWRRRGGPVWGRDLRARPSRGP